MWGKGPITFSLRTPNALACVSRRYCINQRRSKRTDPLQRQPKDLLLAKLKRCTPAQALQLIHEADPADLNTSQFHQIMKLFSRASQIREVFQQMENRKIPIDTKAYTMLIAAHCREGDIAAAIAVKDDMLEKQVRVNQVTYATIMKAISDTQAPMEEAVHLLDEMKRRGLFRNNTVYSTLLIGYGKRKDAAGLKEMIRRMQEDEIEANSYTHRAIIGGFIEVNEIHSAHFHLQELEAQGQMENNMLHNTLIAGYVKEKRFEEALQVLETMRNNKATAPNVVTYTTILHGYALAGEETEVARLLNEMKEAGIRPNEVTLSSLAVASAKRRDFLSARHYLDEMRLQSLAISVDVYLRLIKSALENSEPLVARSFLRDLENLDPGASRSALISQYAPLCSSMCAEGLVLEAESMVDHLVKNSSTADLAWIIPLHNVILQALGKQKPASTENIKRYYQKMLSQNATNAASRVTMLIHSAQQGDTADAQQIYEEMRRYGDTIDVRTFSLLIKGALASRDLQSALNVEEMMIEEGLIPNAVVQNQILVGIAEHDPASLVSHLRYYGEKNVPLDRNALRQVFYHFYHQGQHEMAAQLLLMASKESGVALGPFTDLFLSLLKANHLALCTDLATSFPHHFDTFFSTNKNLSKFVLQQSKDMAEIPTMTARIQKQLEAIRSSLPTSQHTT